MSRIYCSSCGEPNPDAGRFCFACGSRLTKSVDDAQVEATVGEVPPTAPAPARSIVGERLGHYQITALIGRGGFGEVYRATDEKLHREVALKLLPAELAADADRLERFHREARAAAGLNHPNVVTLHSIEESEGVRFLTMELIEGQSLAEHIPSQGLETERFLELAVPLARALAAAHDKGITHRDLKPANVMVGEDGSPKILDFGLAKMRRQVAPDGATQTMSEDLTGEGMILGTVAYMAPEQVQGRLVDQRSDVFSFGLVLYQMATGRRAFTGRSAAEIMSSILRDEPQPLRESRPDLPPEIVAAIERCLRKKPDDRFANARELAAVLEAAQRQSLSASVAMTAPHRSARWVPALVVALVVLAAVVVWMAWRPMSTEAPRGEGIPRIVVLPMDHLGASDDAYFTAGLTDEITSRLAAVAGLGVVSRTSAVQYKDSGKNLRQIGDELDVDYVLEGSVRWQKQGDAGGRIRVTSQLIRVEDDTNLWTESYDRALEDVFDVQSDIAGQVAEQLNLTLLAGERRTVESRPTQSMAAYQAYLRGLDLVHAEDATAAELDAIASLERAVELDPEFALARAWLAHTYARRYGSGTDRSDELRQKIVEQIDRALELEPDLPEAHMARAFYLYWAKLDYSAAMEAFEIAHRGSPNNPRVLAGMAYAIRRAGDLQAAVDYLERAIALDPRDSYLYVEHAVTFMWLRDHDKAMELLDRSIEIEPDQAVAYYFKGEMEWYRSGNLKASRAELDAIPALSAGEYVWSRFWQSVFERDYDTAIEVVLDQDALEPTTWWETRPKSLLSGLAHRLDGRDAEARKAFEEARRDLERRILRTGDDRLGLGRLHGALGIALAGLGLDEDAIRHGRQAMELHPMSEDLLGEARLQEMACIYSMVGEYDAALDTLDDLLSRPGKTTVPYLQLDPMWDPLRSLPRYAELVATYGERDGFRE